MPPVSKATMNAQAKKDEEEVQRLKQRAARQAAAVLKDDTPEDLVDIRILPLGDGKVSMGVHIPGVGDAHYEKGEIAKGWIRENAEALEARGFAEILPPDKA